MYYVYVLKSIRDQEHYIGYAADLKRRLEEHNSGKSKSTRNRVPFELIYYEAYLLRDSAMNREKKLKQFKNSYTHLIKRIYSK